jgi:predicted PurR-regulated permease PerM
VLAAQGVRAVAIGVVVTALVQSLVGGLGLVIAGVPVAGLLTAIMFVASLAQIGAAPVLALAAVWLFVHDSYSWGIAMIAWTVLVASLDNIIRPLLIKKGVDLPLVLLFAGVIGGLIAFGPVGLFIGPVVLAIGYTLLTTWIAEAGAESADEVAPVR